MEFLCLTFLYILQDHKEFLTPLLLTTIAFKQKGFIILLPNGISLRKTFPAFFLKNMHTITHNYASSLTEERYKVTFTHVLHLKD